MARIVLICIFVMCGSLLYGIDSGEIGGFMSMTSFLKDFGYWDTKTDAYNIATPVQLAINLLMLVGSVLACFVAGPIGTRYGRRVGLLCCGLCGLVGPILQACSTHIGTMYVGRIISGAGIGFASNFVPVYQAEVSPTHLRGMLVGLYQAGINIGQFAGACIMEGTYTMSSDWAWRIPLITQMVFPVIVALLVFLLPETPRWLLSVDRREKAARSIRRLRGKKYAEGQIVEEIDNISQHLAAERAADETSSYWDIFKGTDLRRTHIACGLMLFQVWTGISFITTYGTYFYTTSGITDSFLVTVITQACQLAGILVMFPSVHYLGRRTMLLWGGAVQTISIFLVAIIGTALPNSVAAGRCLVAFCCLYGFAFSWAWGPVAWVVTSEISSNALRSKTQSVATTTNWMSTLIIQIILPYLINTSAADLGAKVGFIFGSTCLIGLIWAFIMVPETKGRSLEELDEMFANGVSIKDFPTYVCQGVQPDMAKTEVDVDQIEHVGEEKEAIVPHV
ncbi:hypothetical protein ASPZODRAFT_154425 [Penicilliopsis zonata CBS 506.65]|uniref:Major facilitator superfamily (MFS) profile domain-containing protein n=1 Tax=Penicilliopsis zonata CBS 506.65 TaxID=1073090 RepID=A0A1L9S8Q4_9EURO|nr:hypothetical protein ASPZODRAFT_154425 [Penicilliopsis zonata CBS 506.65]OJJ43541.1 hypothetical protein ASPZODRAFT_154425 [Penicilliopsis zonata CBS 506.65]